MADQSKNLVLNVLVACLSERTDLTPILPLGFYLHCNNASSDAILEFGLCDDLS